MAYVALYRKYRSQSFGELMGQDAVTTVLQNSLRTGKIAHAYLFYGARGCGKTSTARLLSRALNCEASDGPTPEPCGVCRLCVAIRNGACMDVVEIDAASETGVDNVREKIIENVQYVPTEARYKVYIIDEVHDLSTKAFDALLKTLEEPPPHVVFVLATTEQHKVPITIRSRCTQFQFKRGSLTDLSAAVQRVIDQEGFSAEPEAVRAIARCAEGSWRDALSLLEQVLAYSSGTILEATVQDALGTVGSETLAQTVATIAANDWAATLAVAGKLIDSGKDVRQLITSLSGYLRDLLLIASGAVRAAEQELGPERVQALSTQASLFTSGKLLTMLGMLAAAEKETRLSNQHRWLLERTLCSLMPVNMEAAEAQRQPAITARADAPRVNQHASAPSSVTSTPVSEGTSPFAAVREALRQSPTVPPKPTPAPPTTAPQPQSLQPAVSRPVEPTSEDISDGIPERFAGEITLDVVRRAWPRVLKLIEKVSPSAAGYLKQAEIAALEPNTVVLAWDDSFPRERIMGRGKPLVEKKLNEALQAEGYRIRARADGEISPRAAPPPVDVPADPVAAPLELVGAMPDPIRSEAAPVVPSVPSGPTMLEEVLDIFGGEVIKSEPKKPTH